MLHLLACGYEVVGTLVEPEPKSVDRLGGICRCLEASRIQFSLEQEPLSFAALFEGLYVQAESGVNCERAGGPAEIRGVEDPRRIWDGAYEGHRPEA